MSQSDNIRKSKKLKEFYSLLYQLLDLGEMDVSGLANLLKSSWGKKYFELEIEAKNWGA